MLCAAHQEARQTATLLLALGLPTSSATADSFGPYRGLLATAGRGELEAFINAVPGPVVTWDATRRRNLLDTPATFLRNAQHHAQTSAALHMQPHHLVSATGPPDSPPR